MESEDKVLEYDELFNKTLLTRKVGININELVDTSIKSINIKEFIQNKLKVLYEGLCIKEGYVKYDSISVLNYSMGVMKGDKIEYNVVFECSICHPVNGMKIKCLVKNITKAGIRCVISDLPLTLSNRQSKTPIIIFIARDYYYNDSVFNNIKENDTINVEIIGTRYELNDEYIVAFGDLH